MRSTTVTTTCTPGRYIAADPRVASRVLAKAGLRRSNNGTGYGFSVRGHRVEIRQGRHFGSGRVDEDLSKAQSVLTDGGYLVVRTLAYSGSSIECLEVYRAVSTDDQDRNFLRAAHFNKVVTDAGEIIDAMADRQVRQEVEALERAAEQRQAAAAAAKEVAQGKQRALADRLHAAGFTTARASWRDENTIEVSVEDVERLIARVDQ